MTEPQDQDALTRRLRAGDPAAGEPGLDPLERAHIRRRLLEEGGRGRQASSWLLPAAAALALLGLALGLGLRRPLASRPETASARPAAEAAANTARRQIQFTTDAGTLVVWVLQPRLSG